MLRKIKFTRALIVLYIVAAAATGCAVPEKRVDDPEQLYIRGVTRLVGNKNLLFSLSDYEGAQEAFRKIKENYSFSVYAPLAELRLADIHFEREEYDEATAAYNEFVTLHPNHEDAPYAFYRLGMSYFKRMKGVDRDQPAAEKALSYFVTLETKYPASEYLMDASEKIVKCKEVLAGHEFYVGTFYFKNEQYKGAAERFKRSLERFPGFGPKEDALLYLGKSYLAMDNNVIGAATLQRLIKAFPESAQAIEAREILTNHVTEKKEL